MAANTEFEYIMNKLFEVGKPVQLLCFENGINNHRKLKAKWKDISFHLETHFGSTLWLNYLSIYLFVLLHGIRYLLVAR